LVIELLLYPSAIVEAIIVASGILDALVWMRIVDDVDNRFIDRFRNADGMVCEVKVR
jgi:hypothetical protein